MSQPLSGAEATIQGLLRRLRQYAPEARTVSWQGGEHDLFLRVAPGESFSEAPAGQADAAIVYSPERPFTGPMTGHVLLVLAPEAEVLEATKLAERDATRALPLREWVDQCPPSIRFLRPFLVSPAVAHRLWETKWAGQRECIFGDPQAQPPSHGGLVDNVKFHLVTFFGTGLSPVMPATVASACFVPLALLLLAFAGSHVFLLTSVVLAILSSLVSVWLEQWAEHYFRAEDPRQFVLDEVAGLSLTWALLPDPISWWAVLIGFVAFRVFDIFKWGVTWVERLPIRGKVLWDDLLAGLYAGLVTWGILALFR